MSGMDELESLINWLADTDPKDVLDDIADTAMARHNVKRTRRPHIRAIIETAFDLAKARGEAKA